MDDNLINLIELYEIVCEEMYADLSVRNYYGRVWEHDIIEKIYDLDEKGEKLLGCIKSAEDPLFQKIVGILNQLDNFQLVAIRKGLIKK